MFVNEFMVDGYALVGNPPGFFWINLVASNEDHVIKNMVQMVVLVFELRGSLHQRLRACDIQNLSLVENALSILLHFTLVFLEGLGDQGSLSG
jgi:hypothetical protein